MDILKRIRETATVHGDRIALQGRNEKMTYAQLEEYSDRLAVWMNQQFWESNTPVIVYGHKNPYMIVCFLACVKSGRAYCPQDTSIPESRVLETIASVTPDVVLMLQENEQIQSGAGKNLKETQILMLDEIKKITGQEQGKYDSNTAVGAEDVYYIIFTSGSTGKPKGVQITTDCLNHYLDWSVTLVDKNGEHQVGHYLNQAPFSFDLSVMDLYTSLATGGTLHMMEKQLQSDYTQMYTFFEEAELTVWVSTPSFVDVCLADKKFDETLLPHLSTFLFCGEVLTTATVAKLQERFPRARIMNTYGPTESTVAVSEVEITKERLESAIISGRSLSVGQAKPGTWLEIWDDQGCNLKEGEQGEIVIIGDTVSIGYYGRDDLTSKNFLTCEREGRTWRAYKTGDAGYLIDGQLYYNGRIDLQVKLHGYRIEIEDIENNMVRLPQLNHAVVIPNVREGKVRSLTAFVTGNPGMLKPQEFTKEVKTGLKEFLPAYMIPKKIHLLDSIPMNNHGKADRKYLGGLVS